MINISRHPETDGLGWPVSDCPREIKTSPIVSRIYTETIPPVSNLSLPAIQAVLTGGEPSSLLI